MSSAVPTYPTPSADAFRATWTNREPALNRMLEFYATSSAVFPCAAIVVHVHGPAMVNLVWFDSNGGSHGATSVPVLGPADPAPEVGYFARWPDYKRA